MNRDAFIPPKRYSSWIFNEEKCNWVAPIAVPTDGHDYYWDEFSITWKRIA
jgi:hypothetical protein